MDSGRISLPSIDTMLNSRPIHFPTTLLLSGMDQHRSITANHQSYEQYNDTPPASPPLSSSSSSSSSLNTSFYNRHSRSISLDDANQGLLTTTPYMRHLSRHSPTRLGSLVLPSHQGSAHQRSAPTTTTITTSTVLPLPSETPHHLHQRSLQVAPKIDHYPQNKQQQQPSSLVQRQHHYHRRTVSTPYLTTLTSNNHRNSGPSSTLIDIPNRKYLCPECTKSFSRPSSLRTHMFSHTGEKPFACPHPGCDRTFSVQSNMRRHIRVHYSATMTTPYPS